MVFKAKSVNVFTACVAVMMLLVAHAFAQDGLITYQGRLTSSGVPVGTPVTVDFYFYDAEIGGSKVGTFTDTDVVTPDPTGLFMTMIGDDPSPRVPETLFEHGPVWLDVTVDGVALTPRRRIAQTPAAFRSQFAGALVNPLPLAAGVPPIQKDDIVSILPTGNVRGTSIPDAPTPDSPFTVWNTDSIHAERLDASRVLIVWREGVNTYVCVGDFSGPVASYGPPVSTTLYPNYISIAVLDSSRAVLHDSGTSSPFTVVEISGMSATLSAPIPEPADMAATIPMRVQLDGLNSTDFVFCYVSTALNGYVRIGSVSGGGISFGAAATHAAIATEMQNCVVRRLSPTQFGLAFAQGYVSPTGLRFLTGNYSGTSIDLSTSVATSLVPYEVINLDEFQMLNSNLACVTFLDTTASSRILSLEFSPALHASPGILIERGSKPSIGVELEVIDSATALITESGPGAEKYGRKVTFPFFLPTFTDTHGFLLYGDSPFGFAVVPMSSNQLVVLASNFGGVATAADVVLPPAEKLVCPVANLGVAAADSDSAHVLVATSGVVKDYAPGTGVQGPVFDVGSGVIYHQDIMGLGRVGYMTSEGDLVLNLDVD